jgi:glyoxylase I family protein
MKIDHIVISVRNLKLSTKFYSSFLGKSIIGKEDVSWKLGDTKLFITSPYKRNAIKFNKANLGLNHIAFRLSTKSELKTYLQKLDRAKIANKGIQIDKYSKKEFIWFDDPDGIRLEFYL